MKPRLLDLFCGAGGATKGYQRAGFYVVGVDRVDQPRYAGDEFHQADVLEFPLEGFDAIHASPPCQGYTTMNNRHGSDSPLLIDPIRARCLEAGVSYVIENVLGARGALRNPFMLTGEMFGLRVTRPRLFESNVLMLTGYPPPRQKDAVAVYGKLDGRRLWTRADGTELRAPTDLEEAQRAMGIDWMTWDEIREAIPPAYSEHIGSFLMQHIGQEVA